jgi:hypothetical protein
MGELSVVTLHSCAKKNVYYSSLKYKNAKFFTLIDCGCACVTLLLVSQKLLKFGRAENLGLCVTDVCNKNNV